LRRPFAKVIGVERDEGRAEIARENLVRVGGSLRAGAAEIVQASVEEWPLPNEATVVYTLHVPQMVRPIVDQITASLERAPRDLRFVYVNPEQHDQVEASGLRLLRVSRGLRPWDRIHLYGPRPLRESRSDLLEEW
jgi:hypothetical protein